jgi:outer membrane receptor protein involved in Fe transport
MNINSMKGFLSIICILVIAFDGYSQITGKVIDGGNGEELIGANVVIVGTTTGTVTDFDGTFILDYIGGYPIQLEISYLGYNSDTISYQADENPIIKLYEQSEIIASVEVVGQRISDKQKANPLTIESLDILGIKETPSSNFYEGLGSLKDVDLTTASLGFTVINTRGFNSTSPVRSLQIIDGVDNQSPGLNFSLGNFLGASELDIKKVDLIVGASSAFYGPNAFNGVISMETKNPFLLRGLSAQLKLAERNLFEGGLRWAQSVKNKHGHAWFAYKVNLFRLQADDWPAENYDEVFDFDEGPDNPGGYNAVNIYGDEFSRTASAKIGIGRYYRKGYREIDLVDYNTENTKASFAAHFRLRPSMDFESPELILSTSYGGGTTVYQGDNRFSLRDIRFFQHKAEINKKDNYFLRVYATHEDAGNSYDPFFTALKLQETAADNVDWNTGYINYWSQSVEGVIRNLEGFPKLSQFPGDPDGYRAAINDFLYTKQDSLFIWHERAQNAANSANVIVGTNAFFEPGTPEFQAAFDSITGALANSEGGTRFYDKSALIHLHGEKLFNNVYSGDRISDLDFTLGVAGRLYLPNSRGSILLDTGGVNINTYEYGMYGGGTVGLMENKLKLSTTVRLDKHENFNYLISPAASIVYNPTPNNYLRASFSAAVRNPTLTDQYLNYNVGPAILLGNITGYNDLITVESFEEFLNTQSRSDLDTFDVSPIQPEKVRTFELGYRTSLFNSLFIDLGGYYSKYRDFIGYQLGISTFIPPPPNAPLPSFVQAYRVSANASDVVTTQGVSIGLNYYFGKYYQLKGNYSFNRLVTDTEDPIIPAFNTPENKYNIGISGRDIPRILGLKVPSFGFSINYKWVEGFIFEGSPQFTGFIPEYDLLDAQINFKIPKIHTTLKLGASNVLNNKIFQTYGGPRIGRMAYISATYDFVEK